MTATLAKSSVLTPRPYQRESGAALAAAWGRGVLRPAVVLPTGTGKTVVFTHLSVAWHAGPTWAGRVLILVHRDELAEQTLAKLHDVAPHLSVGVVKAARNDVNAHVIVASVQTLQNPLRLAQLREVGLVIVDECHHATAESYRFILRKLGCYDGRAVAAGFTATMHRSDGASLGDVWQEVVYEKSITWAIQRGYLCDVKGRALTVEDFDLSGVRSRAGDYDSGQLGHALEDSSAPKLIAEAYLQHGLRSDRTVRPGIIFTPTVETAHLMAGVFNQHGIRTEAVDGSMRLSDRRALLRDYLAGRIDVFANCDVFTEGTDLPRAEVCVLAKPTRSASKYVQMVGRVLRPFPGKRTALVLDVVGAASRHSLLSLTDLTGTPVRDDETILEALDREVEEAAETPDAELPAVGGGGWWDPKVITVEASEQREVDLFHGSRQTWQQTEGGWWFMAGRDRFVAVLPDERPGSWYAGYFLTGRAGGGGYIERDLADIGYAQSWAESWLADNPGVGADLIDRGARWRKRPPTDAAKRRALKEGCDQLAVQEADTAGALADLIDRTRASRRIDYRMHHWLIAHPEVRAAIGR